jgi:hypothetical protein
MATRTLHIVDGESTGGTLGAAGLQKDGKILVWRDALYTGPVPTGLPLAQLSRVRSRFWTNGKSQTEFVKRDAELQTYGDYDKIVLWFGRNCVLCQLSLIQVLSWLRARSVSAIRLTWVARHGGELPPQKISKVFASRRRVTTAQMRLADRAWRAFREPSPAGLVRLVKSNPRALPGLRPALVRLLQEYPSTRDGISRLERQLLRQIERQGKTKAAYAVGPVLIRESVGDVLLFDMLRNFVRAKHPLLHFAEPFSGRVSSWRFNGSTLALTDTGRQVLRGKADRVAINGIDRWIGGVHLRGKRVLWRWDEKARSVVNVT